MNRRVAAIVENWCFIQKNRNLLYDQTFQKYALGTAKRIDLFRLYRLHSSVFPADERAIFRFLFYWVLGTHSIFVAKNHRALVGYTIYGIAPGEVGEGTAHEYFTGVHPMQKGKGIGTELRIFAQRRIAHLGYRRISSQTLDSNVASIKSLEKAGFRRVGMAAPQSSGAPRSRWIRRLGRPDLGCVPERL